MKHYDHVEWILYKNNLLDDKIYEEMEEHLYLCDDCMEIFLSLIGEEEINQAGSIVSEDFTDKVMDNLKNISPLKKKTKEKPKVTNDFFIYYTAVASVTIILTAGGFFGKLVDSVPRITANISVQESKIMTNAIYNFSEKITNKTAIFVNDFQFSKNKED